MRSPHQWAEQFGIPIDEVREIQRDAMLAIAIKDCGDDPPPRSTFEFRLSVGAESRERLARVLQEFQNRVSAGDQHWDPIGPRSCWGGAGSHGHHALDVREDITPEAYRAELMAWSERQRQRRANEGAAAEGATP